MNSDINKKLKIAVGLSGGVDSSVTAYLLKEQGHDVVGFHMQCWDIKGDGCTAEQDRADAVEVAVRLGIPFHGLNFVNEYKDKVMKYFYSEYQAGRTPNPDVLCNKEIKFGLFLDWALKNGFDMVATGHYARIEHTEGSSRLFQGVDDNKDQSYFLYALSQEQLSKALFPLGGMHKAEVRQIATKLGLNTATKPDSVGICFVGEVSIKDFLKKQIPEKKGLVYDSKGSIVGEHEGAYYYTIGQRHGFKLSKYYGTPVYVLSKNTETNSLVIGEHDEALVDSFIASDINWLVEDLQFPLECEVRVRHLGQIYSCTLVQDGKKITVTCKEKIFGIAPGQSAVFYLNTEVLGGGIIS